MKTFETRSITTYKTFTFTAEDIEKILMEKAGIGPNSKYSIDCGGIACYIPTVIIQTEITEAQK